MAKQSVNEDLAVLRLKLDAADRLCRLYDEQLTQLAEIANDKEAREERGGRQLLNVTERVFRKVSVIPPSASWIHSDLARARKAAGLEEEGFQLHNKLQKGLQKITWEVEDADCECAFPDAPPSFRRPYPSHAGKFIHEVVHLAVDLAKFIEILRSSTLALRTHFVDQLNQGAGLGLSTTKRAKRQRDKQIRTIARNAKTLSTAAVLKLAKTDPCLMKLEAQNAKVTGDTVREALKSLKAHGKS